LSGIGFSVNLMTNNTNQNATIQEPSMTGPMTVMD